MGSPCSSWRGVCRRERKRQAELCPFFSSWNQEDPLANTASLEQWAAWQCWSPFQQWWQLPEDYESGSPFKYGSWWLSKETLCTCQFRVMCCRADSFELTHLIHDFFVNFCHNISDGFDPSELEKNPHIIMLFIWSPWLLFFLWFLRNEDLGGSYLCVMLSCNPLLSQHSKPFSKLGTENDASRPQVYMKPSWSQLSWQEYQSCRTELLLKVADIGVVTD